MTNNAFPVYPLKCAGPCGRNVAGAQIGMAPDAHGRGATVTMQRYGIGSWLQRGAGFCRLAAAPRQRDRVFTYIDVAPRLDLPVGVPVFCTDVSLASAYGSE